MCNKRVPPVLCNFISLCRSKSTNDVPTSESLQQDTLLRQRQNAPNSLLVSPRQVSFFLEHIMQHSSCSNRAYYNTLGTRGRGHLLPDAFSLINEGVKLLKM